MSSRQSSNSPAWLDCAIWLNDCGVLSSFLRNRLQENILTVNELANGLRDGLILCHLMNRIIPGAVEASSMQNLPHSMNACMKNAKLFLDACKIELGFNDQELFQPHMLYNLNIETVISALSKISKTKRVQEILKRNGFNANENEEYQIVEMTNDSDVYISGDVILQDQDDLSAYQLLVNDGKMPKFRDKDHLTREIHDTEKNFVAILVNLINGYIRPMNGFLNKNDKMVLFINFESLHELHSKILEDLVAAIRGQQGRIRRVCEVFEKAYHPLMNEYGVYFSGMKAAESKLQSLEAKDPEFKKKLEECQRNSHEKIRNFQFRDLIKVPFQRILRYHLLLSSLNKSIDAQHNAKKDLEKALSLMQDLAHYLNESNRDDEILQQIDDLNNSIKDPFSNQLILRDFGHLIKDDNIRVRESNEVFARTRYLLIFDKALLICKSNGDNYILRHVLHLTEYKIEEHRNTIDFGTNITGAHLILSKPGDSSKIALHFKNGDQRNEWRSFIQLAQDKVQPKGYTTNGHNFVFTNFGKDIVFCSICKKVLPGSFYQGYKCTRCSTISDKNCLLKHTKCEGCGGSLPPNIPPPRIPSLISTDRTKRQSEFLSYKARALYAYNGSAKQPDADCEPLLFKEGDIIQVTDDDDETWWKGYKLGGNTTEGYYPKTHVRKIEEEKRHRDKRSSRRFSRTPPATPSLELESASYYCACDRDLAVRILNLIQSTETNIFLVRPSADGGFALTIRCKSSFLIKPEHIRIHLLKTQSPDGKASTIFYLHENLKFPTIQDLITHYMKTSLDDIFQQIKGALGTPYRDAIPKPISQAVALHDFIPRNAKSSIEIELRKGNKYYVLNKELVGFWKIYNLDGLIGYVSKNYLQEVN